MPGKGHGLMISVGVVKGASVPPGGEGFEPRSALGALARPRAGGATQEWDASYSE